MSQERDTLLFYYQSGWSYSIACLSLLCLNQIALREIAPAQSSPTGDCETAKGQDEVYSWEEGDLVTSFDSVVTPELWVQVLEENAKQ